MPTLADLTDRVITTIQGDTLDTEQAATLLDEVAADNSAPTMFRTDRVFGAGIIEVDDELMYSTMVDQQSGTVTVPVWGRAQHGSTLAAHGAGAKVTRSPRTTRIAATTEINNSIGAMYPDLWQVKEDETHTADPSVVSYSLPSDCRRVLDIKWRQNTTPLYWFEVGKWRLDTRADTGQFPTGVAVDIYDCMWPGSPIRILYEAEPAPLVNPTDDYATVTGLPEGSHDIPVMLAVSRLIGRVDLAKSQLTTVEQSARSQLVSPGVFINASKYYLARAEQRLQTERDRLMRRYPARIVRL